MSRASDGSLLSPVRPDETLSDRDFTNIQRLVYRSTGIFLSDAKRALVISRLARRLRELEISSFAAYYELVTSPSGEDEQQKMLDAITTNETRFFRETAHFEFLDRLFGIWLADADRGTRSRQIRIWSAGCSSGEEPYSLAMTLLDRFPRSQGWSAEILATDLSTRVLDRARAAQYPLERSGEIPHTYLKRFMLRGVGPNEGVMRVSKEVASIVRFGEQNLIEKPPDVTFDLIFCRNVLIYFDRASKQRVISNLTTRLADDGLLFLGHSETLTRVTDTLRSVVPNVYARPPVQATLLARLGERR